MQLTTAQRKAMIRFTERLEKAYRTNGRPKDAEAAKRHREQLKKEDRS